MNDLANSYESPWMNEELRILRDAAKRFFEREFVPQNERWLEQGKVDREAWLKAGEAGLLCAEIPTAYGGGGRQHRIHGEVLMHRQAMRGGRPVSATARRRGLHGRVRDLPHVRRCPRSEDLRRHQRNHEGTDRPHALNGVLTRRPGSGEQFRYAVAAVYGGDRVGKQSRHRDRFKP